jgi:hypothetical protein
MAVKQTASSFVEQERAGPADLVNQASDRVELFARVPLPVLRVLGRLERAGVNPFEAQGRGAYNL